MDMVVTKKICAIIWISLSILTIAIICIAGDVLSIIFLSSNINKQLYKQY